MDAGPSTTEDSVRLTVIGKVIGKVTHTDTTIPARNPDHLHTKLGMVIGFLVNPGHFPPCPPRPVLEYVHKKLLKNKQS